MSFKLICAFDHMATGSLVTHCGMEVRGNGYGLQPNIWTDPGGRQRMKNGGLYSCIAIPFANIGLDFRKRICMGYRLSSDNYASSAFYLSQGLPSAGADISVSGLTLGLTGDSYIEVLFDFTNSRLTYFVDGVQKLQQQYTTTDMNRFITTSAFLTFYGNNADYYSSITDIYFRDEGPTEAAITATGPLVAYPIRQKDTLGADWTPPASTTLAESLNTLSLAGKETTPVITNAGTAPVTPLVSNLLVSSQNITNIVAVSFIGTAQDSVAPAKTLNSKLTLAGTDAAGIPIPLTTTQVPGKRIGVFDKAPDGTAWTLAKLQQTTLTVTPT